MAADRSFSSYRMSSAFFVEIAERAGDHLGGRASDEWTVLELIAHGDRSHTLVVEYLASDQPPLAPDDPYFAPERIAERARASVRALGDDPVGSVRRHAAEAGEAIRAAGPDAIVHSPLGTMPLARYLDSRTAELVLHGMDLADVLELDVSPPEEGVRTSLELATWRAIARGDGLTVLRALTGRGSLPEGYSIY